MRKTTAFTGADAILIDIEGLQARLNIGKNSCYKVADEAQAVVRIGRRRLYNLDKIRTYLNGISVSGGENNE